MDPPTRSTTSGSKKLPHKRQKTTTMKPSLFDTNRVRNCGSNESFLSTETTGLMDYTGAGSDTEEEDNTELENEYLDKMSDDTDRPVETCFGWGVNVWRSFSGSGTIYADVDDRVKKMMRDEQIWGKKKTLGAGAGEKRQRGAGKNDQENADAVLKMGFSGKVPVACKYDREMNYSRQVKLPIEDKAEDENKSLNKKQVSDKKQGPDEENTPATYTDGNITYPELPQLSGLSELPQLPPLLDAPPSPTLSEWNSFHVSPSQMEDIREPISASDTLLPSPYHLQHPNDTQFHRRSTSIDPVVGNSNRPIKPLPARAQGQVMEASSPSSLDAVTNVPSSTGAEMSIHAGTPSSLSTSSTAPVTDAPSSTYTGPSTPSLPGNSWNAFGLQTDRARRIVSGSFGSFEGRPLDRFDERAYRLAQKGDDKNKSKGKGKAKEDGKDSDDKDDKPNPFKGRPWLRRP